MSSAKPNVGVQVEEMSFSCVGRSESITIGQQKKRWTMLFVYRGKHCPRCKRFLNKLNAALASWNAVLDVIVVSADTAPMQLQALAQGLSSINIGQKPFEMGQLGASLLIDYITKQQLPDKSHYYLGFHHCTPETATTCTTNY